MLITGVAVGIKVGRVVGEGVGVEREVGDGRIDGVATTFVVGAVAVGVGTGWLVAAPETFVVLLATAIAVQEKVMSAGACLFILITKPLVV